MKRRKIKNCDPVTISQLHMEYPDATAIKTGVTWYLCVYYYFYTRKR